MHPKKIAVLADTHGLLREPLLKALEGVAAILHAGDVGKPEILERLSACAPVYAVRGNVDKYPGAEALPHMQRLHLLGIGIYMLHDIRDLDFTPDPVDIQLVISGHSHQPSHTIRDGVHYLNPGSIGPKRFSLPIAMAFVHGSPQQLIILPQLF